MLTSMKGDTNSNTVIVGDFNTPLTPMSRSAKQKVSTKTQTLYDTMDQLDLIDIYRTFHPKTMNFTFFSSAHGTFSRIDHIPGHKSSLDKFQKIEIISSIFSDHNVVRLDVNYRKKRMISVHFWGKPFNNTVIQVYALTCNVEKAEVERFYEDLQDLLVLTPKKDVLFIIGNWNAKVGSQKTPGVTGKFGFGVWNEAGQRLIEFFQENPLVIANTLLQQHKKRLYTWTSPAGQHWNQIDDILCSQRWRSSIQSAKTRPGADYGSDYELLIARFGLKLKKVGKTTRPFKYDLNQIPYDYTVEVRNRFMGLDLIECLMNYGRRFMTLYRRQGSRPSPRKRNAKKQKGHLRRPYK